MGRKRKFYVYILECSDSSYYVGFSNNVTERVIQHNEGIHESAYTFSRRPVILVYSEVYHRALKGIAREKQLKGWSRKKKEALIKGDFEALVLLSRGRSQNKIMPAFVILRQAQHGECFSKAPSSWKGVVSPFGQNTY